MSAESRVATDGRLMKNAFDLNKMIVYLSAISLLPMWRSVYGYYQVNEAIRNDNRGMLRMVARGLRLQIERRAIPHACSRSKRWSSLPKPISQFGAGRSKPAEELFDS
jgi:hypothetical protein